MKMRTLFLSSVTLVVCSMILGGDYSAADATVVSVKKGIKDYNVYSSVVAKTVGMVNDQKAVSLATRYGLNVLNVTWEDTGRYQNSAVGPNISDMTIQVELMDPASRQYQLYCMPVIRFSNFEDKTCDVRMDRFYVLVGNEKNRGLRKINLRDLLGNLRNYLTRPGSWKGNGRSLLAKRDTHVLVSAQACFLPIPKQGDAIFNPVLFNYQSYAKNPAVLTILATREGTSITIIDNQRDAFNAGGTWGQRLFFNQNGERASLMGKRMSDFLKEQKVIAGGVKSSVSAGNAKGLNMVLLIQVPLKHKSFYNEEGVLPSASMAKQECEASRCHRSDVENAVIGHGKVEGPYTEIDNLAIERDERFPVRVTVQFYKATGNGLVNDRDMAEIASQITKVYADADYVGSLVVDGKNGRPTEHDGPMDEPPGWWDSFWSQYEHENGQTREDAIRMFRNLLGIHIRPFYQ